MIARYAIVAAIVNFTLWVAYRNTDHDPISTSGLVVGGILWFGQGLLLAISLAIAQLFSEKSCLKISPFRLLSIAIAQALLAVGGGYVVFLSLPSQVKYVSLVFLSTLFGAFVALCTYQTANRIARMPLIGIMLVSVAWPLALIVAGSFRAFSDAHRIVLGLAFAWHIPLAALVAAWLSSSANTILQGDE